MARHCSSARSTLGELPEVEMARKTSPGWPRASIWRAKSTLEAVVVADGGEDGGIGGESDGAHRRAVVDEAADKLRHQMLRVGGAAAVAGHHELAAGLAAPPPWLPRPRSA